MLALQPSQHLTANEIAAAALADQGERFNPQQQFPVSWPADPVIAKAYVDQLQRSRSLAPGSVTDLTRTLDQAATRLAAGGRDAGLAGRLERLASGLRVVGQDPAAARRATALGETLRGIATRLR